MYANSKYVYWGSWVSNDILQISRTIYSWILGDILHLGIGGQFTLDGYWGTFYTWVLGGHFTLGYWGDILHLGIRTFYTWVLGTVMCTKGESLHVVLAERFKVCGYY